MIPTCQGYRTVVATGTRNFNGTPMSSFTMQNLKALEKLEFSRYYIYIYICACVYTSLEFYVHVCKYIYIYINVCMCINIYIYIFKYLFIFTDTSCMIHNIININTHCTTPLQKINWAGMFQFLSPFKNFDSKNVT